MLDRCFVGPILKERRKTDVKKWMFMFVVSFLLVSACGGIGRDNLFGRRALSEEEAKKARADIIERLASEDQGINRRQLRVLNDAILTVRKDLKPRDLPEDIRRVREVLKETSLRDLQEIERILPEVEKRRKLEGLD